MFSQYCDQKFEVEPVEVITDGKSNVYPDLSCRTFEVDVSYINETIGVQLKPMEVSVIKGISALSSVSACMGPRRFILF